jgi:hypothetical protein
VVENKNKRVLTDRRDVLTICACFILIALRKYKASGRPLISGDEAYIRGSHSRPKNWTDDDDDSGLLAPTSKARELLFTLEEAQALFQTHCSYINLGKNYHNEMDSKNYACWLKPMLIPNLPSNLFLVIDSVFILQHSDTHQLNVREELFVRSQYVATTRNDTQEFNIIWSSSLQWFQGSHFRGEICLIHWPVWHCEIFCYSLPSLCAHHL